MARQYEESHPWITFNLNGVNDLLPPVWVMFGEARSKSQHLAGTPLKPALAEEMNRVTLIKGAQATTAIEGNTLSEEQVAGIYDGTFEAPPSRHYQEVEVRNVLESLRWIDDQAASGEYPKLTPELIRNFNLQVLDGLDLEEGVVPGKLREKSVVVGPYRGAPAEDGDYLLSRLCEWLEGPDFTHEDDSLDFALLIVRAVMAHLFIAWIHPFGDGNGRTARLVEYLILARSGKVPLLAAHLLSNHYNLTRDRYYRELAHASRSRQIGPFIAYAVEGFIDGIREEIEAVRDHQLRVAWENYVHETMGQFATSKACDRQRDAVLAMQPGKVYTKDEMETITPDLARQYGAAGPRTIARDLNRLRDAGLVSARRAGRAAVYVARVGQMEAFMPLIGSGED